MELELRNAGPVPTMVATIVGMEESVLEDSDLGNLQDLSWWILLLCVLGFQKTTSWYC